MAAFKYPVILMLLIFVESSIPMDGGSGNIKFLTELDPTLQNLLHVPLYGTLAFLWVRSLVMSGIKPSRAMAMALLIVVFYGCLDEVHQSFVPGRFGGLTDIYLDCIGGVLGVFICRYYMRDLSGEI